MLQSITCDACRKNDQDALCSIPATTERTAIGMCPNGHTVGIIFQADGWARLFERGLERIALGELRDAVLDIYTAFEMYLAVVPVRVRYDLEAGASPTKLRAELRLAIQRAEPSIGAARAAASIATGKPAIRWSEEKTTQIRNKAIHAGIYPKEEEARELCVEVERTILEFEKALTCRPSANTEPFYKAVWKEEADLFMNSHPGLRTAFVIGSHLFECHDSTDWRPAALSRIEEYRKGPGTVLRAMLMRL